MIRVLVVAVMLLALTGGAWCADDASGGERRFLSRNSVRGYIEFQVGPPHNEPDLGFCVLTVNNPSPRHPDCTAYARYVWNGYVEFQPVGRGPLRRLFLFYEPQIFGGDNLPQRRYTASAAPILWEHSVGFGFDLLRGVQLRVKHHAVSKLGRFSKPGNSATLRTDGPYGLYTTIGVRWNFGGWGSSGR